MSTNPTLPAGPKFTFEARKMEIVIGTFTGATQFSLTVQVDHETVGEYIAIANKGKLTNIGFANIAWKSEFPKAGSYTFRVHALNSEGLVISQVSEETATIKKSYLKGFKSAEAASTPAVVVPKTPIVTSNGNGKINIAVDPAVAAYLVRVVSRASGLDTEVALETMVKNLVPLGDHLSITVAEKVTWKEGQPQTGIFIAQIKAMNENAETSEAVEVEIHLSDSDVTQVVEARTAEEKYGPKAVAAEEPIIDEEAVRAAAEKVEKTETDNVEMTDPDKLVGQLPGYRKIFFAIIGLLPKVTVIHYKGNIKDIREQVKNLKRRLNALVINNRIAQEGELRQLDYDVIAFRDEVVMPAYNEIIKVWDRRDAEAAQNARLEREKRGAEEQRAREATAQTEADRIARQTTERPAPAATPVIKTSERPREQRPEQIRTHQQQQPRDERQQQPREEITTEGLAAEMLRQMKLRGLTVPSVPAVGTPPIPPKAQVDKTPEKKDETPAKKKEEASIPQLVWTIVSSWFVWVPLLILLIGLGIWWFCAGDHGSFFKGHGTGSNNLNVTNGIPAVNGDISQGHVWVGDIGNSNHIDHIGNTIYIYPAPVVTNSPSASSGSKVTSKTDDGDCVTCGDWKLLPKEWCVTKAVIAPRAVEVKGFGEPFTVEPAEVYAMQIAPDSNVWFPSADDFNTLDIIMTNGKVYQPYGKGGSFPGGMTNVYMYFRLKPTIQSREIRLDLVHDQTRR